MLSTPKHKVAGRTKYDISQVRNQHPRNKAANSTFITEFDWSILDSLSSCDEKWSAFESIIRFGMDILLPTKTIKKRLDDPPWMTQHLKSLIQQRQKSLAKGHDQLFKSLRNRVNRERKQCRSKYYDSKVSQLKLSDPKQWWKSVKYLCGMDPVNHKYDLRHLQSLSSTGDETSETNEGNASLSHLANTINQTFLEPMNTFQPLNSDHSHALNVSGTSNQLPSTITTTESYIFQKLSSIVPTKAHGPDTIPGWLLKENADVLASSVCTILNSSYLKNRLPAAWKLADVIPIPKQKPARTVNKDLRPVSLTPIVSKLAEEVIVEQFIKPAILKVVDPNQYGTVPKSSTTQALISIVHNVAKATDGNGALVRLVLLDFRKAFDLIDHQLLMVKLHSLDVPPSVINWVRDFLTNRQQRVKLANDCYSEWSLVPASVPQGIKLGPWLYILMINDLNTVSNSLWKYVDDTTLAEVIPRGGDSNIQSAVDDIQNQSNTLKFTLNEDKCKDMRIQFSRDNTNYQQLPLVTINGKQVDLAFQSRVLDS